MPTDRCHGRPDLPEILRHLPRQGNIVQTVVDPAANEVWELLRSWTTLTQEPTNWRRHLSTAVKLRVVAPASIFTNNSDGESIQKYVTEAHDVVLAIASEEVAKISKRRWLDYARRLPEQVLPRQGSPDNDRIEGEPYLASLLDSLTAIYGAEDDRGEEELTPKIPEHLRRILDRVKATVSEPAGTSVFLPKATDGLVLCRVTECVKILAQLQDVFRSAGRGARFILPKDGWVPKEVQDREFKSAQSDYDRRMRVLESSGRFPQIGTIAVQRAQAGPPESTLFIVGRHPSPGWQTIPDLSFPPDLERGLAVDAKFGLNDVSLELLKDLLSKSRGLAQTMERSIATAIGLLAASLPVFIAGRMGVASLAMFGLVSTKNDEVERGIAAGFPRVEQILDTAGIPRPHLQTPADLIREATNMRAAIWPVLRGGLIRRDHKRSVIDLYGASAVMGIALRRSTSTGSDANIRAAHFEDQTQRIIDATPWKPTDDLRRMRRRTLRLDTKDLTDIDAIAAKATRLLLISCKSLVHSTALEIGDYAATRNMRTLVQESVDHWSAVVARLRERPKGDNFDFSNYEEILGVMCLPTPPFLLDTRLRNLRSAPGLRTVSTVHELEDWLNRT